MGRDISPQIHLWVPEKRSNINDNGFNRFPGRPNEQADNVVKTTNENWHVRLVSHK
jgi:hypothetical protein